MNVFLAGKDVSQLVDLVDGDGNQLNVSSISYRVTDEVEAEVIPLTVLGGFVAGGAQATVVIPAASNTLGDGVARGLRAIELQCLVGGNTVVLRSAYTIEVADPLVIGLNSFQSLAAAEFASQTIASIPGWAGASTQQRIAAMIQARHNICRLNFAPIGTNKFWGMNSLNFIPEGTRDTNYIGDSYLFGGDLSMVTPEQFVKLPKMLLDALCVAQVVEADVLLGGDPIETRRQQGLVLDTVGESKQMFRTGKPLELPVSRRALGYLGRFITFSQRIARN